MTRRFQLIGGPTPYREALAARLGSAGFVDAGDVEPDVVVEFVDRAARWTPSAAGPDGPRRVAVLAELAVESYAIALAAGHAAVAFDTSTEIMVAVVEAALRHEVLLPAALGQQIAVRATGRPDDAAGRLDRELADLLVAGHTVRDIAERLHYSDRTIRRRVQALYLALGVATRAEAIGAIAALDGEA